MKKLAFTLLFIFLLPITAFAKDARVAQAETWLQNLKTSQARFTQKGYDGTVLQGNFYISRPGRLRFEYDPPVADLVVADGLMLYFYDAQQKQASSAPIGTTLADFLLRKNARLDGDLKVMNVRSRNGMTSMVVTQVNDPSAGQLQLNFIETPFQLKSWQIIDAQGLTTDITLNNLVTGMALPPALFVFKDPSGRGRLND